MDKLTQTFAVIGFAAAFAVAPVLSHAAKEAKDAADYTVFVDPPTGFVFVKLTAGWKFVGKVEAKDPAQLPARVEAALLTGDDDADDASRMAKQQAL